jgi:hypothetical protein
MLAPPISTVGSTISRMPAIRRDCGLMPLASYLGARRLCSLPQTCTSSFPTRLRSAEAEPLCLRMMPPFEARPRPSLCTDVPRETVLKVPEARASGPKMCSNTPFWTCLASVYWLDSLPERCSNHLFRQLLSEVRRTTPTRRLGSSSCGYKYKKVPLMR